MAAAGWWSSVADQGRVVALQRAQDLASHRVVGVAVVAHVEMGELLLRHAPLVVHPLADAGQQRAGGVVVPDVQGGLDRVRRLRVAVLAHERVAEAEERVAVARLERQRGAGGGLRARPVLGLQHDLHERDAGPRARGLDAGGALEVGRGLGEEPARALLLGLGHEHRFEQVAQRLLAGEAREEVLGQIDVRRVDGAPRVQLLDERGGLVAIGLGDPRRRRLQLLDLWRGIGRHDGRRRLGVAGQGRRGLGGHLPRRRRRRASAP